GQRTRGSDGTVEGIPKLITAGARDLVIVDDKSIVFRWRAADTKGKGTTTRDRVAGAASWGDDIAAIGTFVRDRPNGLYNLYLVDPSRQNIEYYTPARDGSGFPGNAQGWLTVDRDVSKVTDLLIDGDLFLADGGSIVRYVGGTRAGWDIQPPGYTPAPRAGGRRGAGRRPGGDPPPRRPPDAAVSDRAVRVDAPLRGRLRLRARRAGVLGRHGPRAPVRRLGARRESPRGGPRAGPPG